MERLKRAIERARAERQGEIGNLPRDGSEPHQTARKKQTRGADSPRPFNFDFEYTHTRCVELDPKVIEQNRVIAGAQGDARVETYRQLRTQVLQTLNNNNWSTLAITSPMKNAGKSLTAINLAITLSHELDHTVLLVDLDLSHPSVHSTLGVDVEWGILDAIEGRVGLDKVLFNPGMPRLTVLPGKPLVQYPSEILSSPGMRALLNEVKSRYESRFVIFDLPPLLRNDDALKFTPYADATLMVVEAGVNTPDEVERSLHLMRNANLVGTILNKARV